MKIDFTQTLKELDGTEMMETQTGVTQTGEKIVLRTEKVLTLLKVSVDAIMATYDDERTLSGEEKMKRYDLALKITAMQTENDLTVEEVAMIKKLIAKGFGTKIVGPAWKMLEGK